MMPKSNIVWHHPEAIEREYEKVLKQYARRCQRACNELLITEISGIVELAQRYRPDALENSEEQNDGSWVSRLNAALQSVLGAVLGKRLTNIFSGMKGPASASDVGVADYAVQVSDHNNRQLKRIIKRAYDLDVRKAEPWLPDLLKAWESENLKLIRSIPEQYVDKLQGLIIGAINEGKSSTDVQQIIRATYPQPVNRAQLIAVDQIGKLNGQLTRFRQLSVGIKEYTWRGVMDSKERRAHVEREGKTFKWTNPPYDGHPGHPIGCRCWASPTLPPKEAIDVS